MACQITQGFLQGCLEGVGGAKEVLFANWSAFQSGVTFDATTGEVDALPEATIYRYVPVRNSLSWVETANPNPDNNTLFYTNEIQLRIGGLTAAKRKEFMLLEKSKLVAFIRLQSDKIVVVGLANGLWLTAGVGGSGKLLADFAGNEFTLSSDQPEKSEYLEQYTVGTDPFSNFPDITVSPDYSVVS